jgi:hypothetical protein
MLPYELRIHNLKARPPVFLEHVVMRRTEPSYHASVNLFVDLCADYAFGDSEIEIGPEVRAKARPKHRSICPVAARDGGGVGRSVKGRVSSVCRVGQAIQFNRSKQR